MNKRYIHYFVLSFIFFFFGLSYVGVPLYQLFCQQTGFGGRLKFSENREMVRGNEIIKITFTSNVDVDLPVLFYEKQKTIEVIAGQPVLVFYESTNLTDDVIYGIRTYNVTPSKAAQYFHKIECFCFDEQRWKGKESIEMPILFYVDADIVDISNITLSYTLFKSRNRI